MPNYRTFWSEEDQEYVGVCDRYPSLSHLDPDEAEALAGIKALVAYVEEDMTEEEREDVIAAGLEVENERLGELYEDLLWTFCGRVAAPDPPKPPPPPPRAPPRAPSDVPTLVVRTAELREDDPYIPPYDQGLSSSAAVTQGFIAYFNKPGAYDSVVASMAAVGELPQGLDLEDPRVQGIITICKESYESV